MREVPASITAVTALSLPGAGLPLTADSQHARRQWPVDSQLWLTVTALQADGSVSFEGEGLRLLLSNWPASLPLPGSGVSWPFRVVAGGEKPQLQLLWDTAKDAAGEAPGEPALSTMRLPLIFRPAVPAAAALAASYREAMLGRLAAASAQFHHEAGLHLSGGMLALAGDQALAALRQPAPVSAHLPLSLPLWLWGGPVLILDLEDAPAAEEDDLPPLDLLWQLTLAEGLVLHGRLRWQPQAIWLDVWGNAEACARFAALWPQMQQRLADALISLDLHLGSAPRMGGMALGAHGVSLFEPSRLLLLLFQALSLLLAVLCPPDAES